MSTKVCAIVFLESFQLRTAVLRQFEGRPQLYTKSRAPLEPETCDTTFIFGTLDNRKGWAYMSIDTIDDCHNHQGSLWIQNHWGCRISIWWLYEANQQIICNWISCRPIPCVAWAIVCVLVRGCLPCGHILCWSFNTVIYGVDSSTNAFLQIRAQFFPANQVTIIFEVETRMACLEGTRSGQTPVHISVVIRIHCSGFLCMAFLWISLFPIIADKISPALQQIPSASVVVGYEVRGIASGSVCDWPASHQPARYCCTVKCTCLSTSDAQPPYISESDGPAKLYVSVKSCGCGTEISKTFSWILLHIGHAVFCGWTLSRQPKAERRIQEP